MAIYTSGFICQYLIDEGPEHIFSAIRIIDRIEVDVPTDLPAGTTVVTAPISFYAVVSFRSDGPEDFEMVFTAVAPGDIRLNPTTRRVQMEGGISGQTFGMRLNFDPRNIGLWWFEIKVNGNVVLRMPLELAPQKDFLPQTGTLSPKQKA